MKTICQNGDDGCGIACFAMISGISYEEAKKYLPKHWEVEGTKIEELQSELISTGFYVDASRWIGRDRDRYKTFGFNAIIRGWLDGDDHFTVWDAEAGQLRDPFKGGRTFHCTSFIRVRTTRRP